MKKGISIHAADARESGSQVFFHYTQTINFETPPFKAQLKRRNFFFCFVQDWIKFHEQIWGGFEVNCRVLSWRRDARWRPKCVWKMSECVLVKCAKGHGTAGSHCARPRVRVPVVQRGPRVCARVCCLCVAAKWKGEKQLLAPRRSQSCPWLCAPRCNLIFSFSASKEAIFC